MNRYQVLLEVLDQIRREAPLTFTRYHPADSEVELVNGARSLAFIHLLLKVYFGLVDFNEREEFVTDGTNDGGIDAYHIDREARIIYFIQSKFRHTLRNFEEKTIDPEEVLKMDIDRILNGETTSEDGVPYNGKILAMVRRIREIDNISRYAYRVIILANARGITRQKLSVLTGGFACEVIDCQACYNQLLFPLVSGTYYSAEELHVALNLSNKNAGAKISYSVQTEHAKTEITVVFVPTLEIAKAMYKYRNSILKYNPRSYLEHEGQNVNRGIRASIEIRHSNEFALFNNGITLLSDDTSLNERIGQKDRAQLTLVNPQIINGGQTAYTLSQIYKDNLNGDLDGVFGQKEVLVKIITFDRTEQLTEELKLELIESISRATNSQTAVTNADRRSNEPAIQALQHKTFDRLGIFLERKRGEFTDGIREKYIDERTIVDRNIFLRAAMIVQNRLKEASEKKLAARCDYRRVLEVSDEVFIEYGVALLLLRRIHYGKGKNREQIRHESVWRAYVGMLLVRQRGVASDANAVEALADAVQARWKDFREFCETRRFPREFSKTKKGKPFFDMERYLLSESLKADALEFFQ